MIAISIEIQTSPTTMPQNVAGGAELKDLPISRTHSPVWIMAISILVMVFTALALTTRQGLAQEPDPYTTPPPLGPSPVIQQTTQGPTKQEVVPRRGARDGRRLPVTGSNIVQLAALAVVLILVGRFLLSRARSAKAGR